MTPEGPDLSKWDGKQRQRLDRHPDKTFMHMYTVKLFGRIYCDKKGGLGSWQSAVHFYEDDFCLPLCLCWYWSKTHCVCVRVCFPASDSFTFSSLFIQMVHCRLCVCTCPLLCFMLVCRVNAAAVAKATSYLSNATCGCKMHLFPMQRRAFWVAQRLTEECRHSARVLKLWMLKKGNKNNNSYQQQRRLNMKLQNRKPQRKKCMSNIKLLLIHPNILR